MFPFPMLVSRLFLYPRRVYGCIGLVSKNSRAIHGEFSAFKGEDKFRNCLKSMNELFSVLNLGTIV